MNAKTQTLMAETLQAADEAVIELALAAQEYELRRRPAQARLTQAMAKLAAIAVKPALASLEFTEVCIEDGRLWAETKDHSYVWNGVTFDQTD